MKNFNAWAIANIEMIFIAPVLLGALVAFAKFVEATGGGSDNTKGVVMILLFIACYFTPTKSTKGDLGKSVCTVILIAILSSIGDGVLCPIIWVSVILGLIATTFVAIYTHKNIVLILSRRILYRNSGVDLFEIVWKYIFNRFIAIFVSFTFLLMEIIGFCFL